MMKRKLSFSALLLLGALPLGALAAQYDQYAQAPAASPPVKEQAPSAAPAPAQSSLLFEQLDANRDGFVTVEEAKRSADITARFKTLDANRDAKISADEFKKGSQEKT